MAKYKKHADGLYKTTISTRKYDESGKLIVIPLSAPSSHKLEVKAGETRTRLKLGIYANDRVWDFGTYADHWYNTYPKLKNQDSSKYKKTITDHCAGIRSVKLSDLTRSDIQELINAQDGHPDNQRMIKLTVNQILESAIEDGLIYKNVCRTIRIRQERNTEAHRPLTDMEKEVISKLKESGTFLPMEQLFIDTLYCSGIRTEEALALTFDDVKGCRINIDKALTWRGGKKLKSPKTAAGYRSIDVPAWYQGEVDLYRATSGGKYLFPGKNGELISQSTYKRFWNGIYNKINTALGGKEKVIKNNKVADPGTAATDLCPYDFRHNYCTMLYYLHVDVKDAARIMGHSSVRITLEIYTHLDSLRSSTQEKIAQITL